MIQHALKRITTLIVVLLGTVGASLELSPQKI